MIGGLHHESLFEGKITELTFVLSVDEELTLVHCDIETIDWFHAEDGNIAIQLTGKAEALIRGPKVVPLIVKGKPMPQPTERPDPYELAMKTQQAGGKVRIYEEDDLDPGPRD